MRLSASERVTLIDEVAKRLSQEKWSLIDTTLVQFKLPTEYVWDGQSYDYVIAMIQHAADESLVDLAHHVGYQFNQANTPLIEPSFWGQAMLRVFLTHLSKHRMYAAKLQEALLTYGISCFVAHNDIEPTAEWQQQVVTALSTCHGLIALLHANFHDSQWTDQEIGFAMGRGVPVFAVRYDQDPYGFISHLQAFSGNDKEAGILALEMFDAYRRNKQTKTRMSEVIVALFESSPNYAEAKRRMVYLEELEDWKLSFSESIISAAKNNLQISDAWGIPERVEALVKKWRGREP